MKWKSVIFSVLILQLLCCKEVPRSISPAFYHWQTNLSLTKTEYDYLDSLKVEKLYVKFFDVDWSSEMQDAVPLAMLEIEQDLRLKKLAVIPTVFITNRTLKKLDNDKLPALAKNIYIKIVELARPLPNPNFEEVQFDCDWSETTKGKYFDLLKLLKTHFQEEGRKIQLSATIRLHQIKYYQQTGVPPVDRGMLMYYNTGDLDDWNTENSILDLAEAEAYIANFDHYPLALDVALPMFSWGILYRNGKFIKLINNLRAETLEKDSRFAKTAENRFQVLKSTYLDGYYLYEADLIRTEKVDLPTLEKSAQLLRKTIENSELSVAFYHLDTATIKHYPYAELEAIYSTFR